jgi:hypothetical protein
MRNQASGFVQNAEQLLSFRLTELHCFSFVELIDSEASDGFSIWTDVLDAAITRF